MYYDKFLKMALTLCMVHSLSLYGMFATFKEYSSGTVAPQNEAAHTFLPYEYDKNSGQCHINYLPECTYGEICSKDFLNRIVIAPIRPCIAVVIKDGEKVIAIHKQYQNPIQDIVTVIKQEFPHHKDITIGMYSTDMGNEYTLEWKKRHNNRSQKEEMFLIVQTLSTLGIPKKNITLNLFTPSPLDTSFTASHITIDHSGIVRNINVYDSGITDLKSHSKFYFLGNQTEHAVKNKDCLLALQSRMPVYVQGKLLTTGYMNIVKKEVLNCGNCPTCKKSVCPEHVTDYGFYLGELSTVGVMLGLEIIAIKLFTGSR